MSNSDNPKVGAVFQKQVWKWFRNHYQKGFVLEKNIPIGEPQKNHKFDIVSGDNSIAVECKRYTWTKSGNVPSAKMGFTNEAAFYLSFLPDSYEKYIVLMKSYNPKRQETLADYYYRINHHLIRSVKVIEYDPENNSMRLVGDNRLRDMPVDCYVRPAQIPLKWDRFNYLTNQYFPSKEDKYVMVQRNKHFMIYDNESGECLFDVAFSVLHEEKEAQESDSKIAAVVTKITISQEKTIIPDKKKDDFVQLMNILQKEL